MESQLRKSSHQRQSRIQVKIGIQYGKKGDYMITKNSLEERINIDLPAKDKWVSNLVMNEQQISSVIRRVITSVGMYSEIFGIQRETL